VTPTRRARARRDGRSPPGPLGARAVLVHTKAALAWWARTRLGRANARFGAAGGGLLTGGIAYAALFSVMAGLTLGFAVLSAVVGPSRVLRAQVVRSVSVSLPGLIDTGNGSGAISPDALRLNAGLNIAGVVAVVVLALSATSCMAALRTAVRAMFKPSGPTGSMLTSRLRELAGFAAMAGAVLVSAVLTTALTGAVHWTLGPLGLGKAVEWAVTILGVMVSFIVDALTFVLVLTVLAGLHPPRRDLRRGALIAGAGLGLARLLGTSVVAGSVGKNALLASFTLLVTLLVWINLTSRIVLLSAAWVANPPAPTPPTAPAPEKLEPAHSPGPGTQSANGSGHSGR
jgi:membrane protein